MKVILKDTQEYIKTLKLLTVLFFCIDTSIIAKICHACKATPEGESDGLLICAVSGASLSSSGLEEAL